MRCLPVLLPRDGHLDPQPPMPQDSLWSREVIELWEMLLNKDKITLVEPYLSRGKQSLQLGHSWAPSGPRNAPSCPENLKQSSSLPMCTETECDLNKMEIKY